MHDGIHESTGCLGLEGPGSLELNPNGEGEPRDGYHSDLLNNAFHVPPTAKTVRQVQNQESSAIAPPDDHKQRRRDVTLAREALGWEPSISLDEGQKSTMAYFETWLRGEMQQALHRRVAL
jgi:nucleoside-diphosphate-sugar epimerase